MYLKKDHILNIFSSKNIFTCFQNIKAQKPILALKLDDEQITAAKRIVFDKKDRFVALVSLTQIIIISLIKGEIGKIVQNYQIDLDNYTMINDVIIDSSACMPGTYKCVIASKVSHQTSIHIFDINKPEDYRSIAFITHGGDIVVKISDDFQKVIFSNGTEHYMLNGVSQDNFSWIKDKFIRNVINHQGSFYLCTSKDYDRDIDILHSEIENFNASFVRSIEPGLLNVYDTIVFNDGTSEQGYLKTLMKIGDYLYLDTLDIGKCHQGGECGSV